MKNRLWTTWRVEILAAMAEHGETWADVEACTLSAKALDRQFDAALGDPAGESFTLWTKHWVYFSVGDENGAMWIEWIPRHLDGTAFTQ